MQLKVMLITGSYPPMKCGVGAYTKRLAEALAELQGVKVFVLTDTRAQKHSKNPNVEVIPVIKNWRIGEIFRVLSILKKYNPDIVHIQYPTQGYANRRMPLFLPLLVRLYGKKCVQTWHEARIRRFDFLLALNLDALVSVRKGLINSVPKLTRNLILRTPFFWIPGASLLPTVKLTEIQSAEIRQQYAPNGETLLVYYGFVAPLKGIESLFEVMLRMSNAKLVMVFDLRLEDSYHRSLLEKSIQMNIDSRVRLTGFLPDEQLAAILAAADAVVLPFRDGGGDWNTSIDGAVSQGVFVLTTSLEKRGYDTEMNTCFVAPGDVDEMVSALQKYAGVRVQGNAAAQKWREVAQQHLKVYTQLV